MIIGKLQPEQQESLKYMLADIIVSRYQAKKREAAHPISEKVKDGE
ncbi:hypothetical protein [Paenibacillus sp. OV219]|nr:hypothetical protein [Paenibacillus sp. OV219]SEN21336.1 hypothetical protein SAMN05518847_102428 [Paenibacillus sp. OV219]